MARGTQAQLHAVQDTVDDGLGLASSGGRDHPNRAGGRPDDGLLMRIDGRAHGTNACRVLTADSLMRRVKDSMA